MLNQFFGHYLLNKGILTQNQLCEVLQSEQHSKVKLGVLAVDAGLMTAAQVESIHHLQWLQDKRFGELAIQQGYLTREQVQQLLDSQQSGHLVLMQTIADRGYMTLNEVEEALAEFRKEYNITSNLDADDNVVIKKLTDFSSAGDRAASFYDYVGLLLRNVVRFLNGTPFSVKQFAEREQKGKWYVCQQIVGDLSLSTGLLMDETVLLEIASRFYGEKLSVADELALDSVSEFLNVHNGVFCSLLSDAGFKTDLQPPFGSRDEKPFQAAVYRIAVGTSFGQFELILSL